MLKRNMLATLIGAALWMSVPPEAPAQSRFAHGEPASSSDIVWRYV